MAFLAEDHCDVGTLIGYALQPMQRPGRSPEYRRTLARYRSESEFRVAVDGVLHGMHVRVLSDSNHGLMLGVAQESPFAYRLADLPNTSGREGQLMAGLILVALAAWAFPRAEDMDDDVVRRVIDTEFESWLRELCETCRAKDEAGEPIPVDGLDEAWRCYLAMPSVMLGDRGRELGTGRLSSKCTMYWVRTMLGWLRDQGMARIETAADGSWTFTERFRVQVADMATEEAFRQLAALGRTEDGR